MNVFEIILAAMLFLQAPGKSIYSQVVVEPTAPPPCADTYSLLCRPPQFSPFHNSYVVAENYEQGLKRYALIAKQLEKAVYHSDSWATSKDRLWRYVIVAVYHESGFRRDVHEGVGEASHGDCDWTGPVGKRKRIPGSCRSYCLGQIMLLSKGAKTSGWRGKELTGLDEEATFRCLYTVTKHMDRSAQYCIHEGNNPSVQCVMGAYGGGGLLLTDKRLRNRYKTYNKMLAAPTKLDDTVRVLLGLPENVATGPSGPIAKAAP